MNGKPWFLYLIECQDGSIYTGITVDVAARYSAHENGTGARYTRSHPPQCLLAVVEYANRSEASKAEYAMKKLSASAKRTFVTAQANSHRNFPLRIFRMTPDGIELSLNRKD